MLCHGEAFGEDGTPLWFSIEQRNPATTGPGASRREIPLTERADGGPKRR